MENNSSHICKPSIEVAAAAIFRDGLILITTRPVGSYMEGLWELPGGKREKNESLEQCLEREIIEEIGISVKIKHSLKNVKYEYESFFISLTIFVCSCVCGNPRGLQGQKLLWVKPEDLVKYRFPPADMEVIPFLADIKNQDNLKFSIL